MDDDQLGEFAYDYVEVRRDYLAWTPAKDEPEKKEIMVNPEDRHGIAEHSNMIQGQSVDGEGGGGGDGSQETRIQGGRHAVAAEDGEKAKAKAKEMNGNGNGNGNLA